MSAPLEQQAPPRLDARAALRHTLADLLRFGGAAGFAWPPRRGAALVWPDSEALLLDALAACARADRQALQPLLAQGDRLCAALYSGPADWWAGAAAFLAAGVRNLQLEPAVPDGLRRVLLAEDLVCRHEHEQALRVLPSLLARLEHAGLRPVLLKGLALAHALYPVPHVRPCGDADVLVAPDEAPRAWQLLLDEGFLPAAGEVQPPGHHHLPPLARRRDGWTLRVELHTRLVADGHLPGLDPATVLARSGSLSLGGPPLRVPCETHLFAHLMLHHPGELRLRRALDALLAAQKLGPTALRRLRRSLPHHARWRLDLLAGVASHLDRSGRTPWPAPATAATPTPIRLLLAFACVPDWGRRHLLAERLGRTSSTKPGVDAASGAGTCGTAAAGGTGGAGTARATASSTAASHAATAGIAGIAGLVRRPVRAALDRIHELLAAFLPVLLRELPRRALALLRLPRDLWRARQ